MTMDELYRGVHYRPKTSDAWIIREMDTYFPLALDSDDFVIDLGANIGAFTVLRAPHCAEVICIEPEAGNLEVLRANVKIGPGPGVHGERRIVQAAVVPNTNEDEMVTLWVNQRAGQAIHSLHHVKGRVAHEVPALRFEDMLNLMPHATALKCDIEGTEHFLPWNDLFETEICKLAVELHLAIPYQRELAYATVIAIERAGFKPIARPPDIRARITTLGFWER